MKEIVFEKALLGKIEFDPSKATITTAPAVIRIVAVMTAATARALGLGSLLFNNESDVKSGFEEMALSVEMTNLRLKFNAPKIPEGLDLYVDKANKFKAALKGDGKKKPKKLMVTFRVHTTTNAFQLLEYVFKVGGAAGVCRLQARQEELFDTTPIDTIVQEHEADGWTARIEIKETPAGYSMTRRASGNGKKFNQVPAADYASESEARQAGAEAIQTWARKAGTGVKGKAKGGFEKLINWCATFINAQPLTLAKAEASIQ